MKIQKYCEDCQHRLIVPSLKQKFNKYSHKTFISCPEKNPKVVGCLIKSNIIFDWGEFGAFLEERGELLPAEKQNLKMLRLYKPLEETSEIENKGD